MMNVEHSKALTMAHDLWRGGEPLTAGKCVFEQVPAGCRPQWAAGILQIAIARGGPACEPVSRLLDVSKDRAQWKQSHDLFDAIRVVTLRFERRLIKRPGHTKALCQLYLAENVAKVIYNAAAPVDPFDEDSGWWVVSCLRDLVEVWNDPDFEQEAWSAVVANCVPS